MNLCGKSRKVENPYCTITNGGWTWRILKHYQTAVKERANPYARVLVAVKSPYTFGEWEMGDAYARDIAGDVIQEDEVHKAWRDQP